MVLFQSMPAAFPSTAVDVRAAPAKEPLSNLSGKFTLSLVHLFVFTRNSVLWYNCYFASECSSHFAPGRKKRVLERKSLRGSLKAFRVTFPD